MSAMEKPVESLEKKLQDQARNMGAMMQMLRESKECTPHADCDSSHHSFQGLFRRQALRMQKESSKSSSMAISPSAQLADIFTATLNSSMIFKNAASASASASASTYTTSSLASTTSATAAILSLMMIAHEEAVTQSLKGTNPVTLLKRSDGLKEFADLIMRSSFAALLSATRFHASSPAAGPSDSHTEPYVLSSSSSESDILEQQLGSSDEEEGQEVKMQSVAEDSGEKKDIPHWKLIPIFQRIRHIDTGVTEDIKVSEVCMYGVQGYFSFAKAVRSASPDPREDALAHVTCPWSPQFNRTEYYDINSGMLDPLTMSWEVFKTELDRVVMINGEEILIAIRISKNGISEFDVRIPKSVCDSYDKFMKVIYFYHTGYEKRDPEDLSSVYYAWPGADLEYYNALEQPLNIPEEGEREEEEGSDGNAETDAEEQEEDGGEIVDDGSDRDDGEGGEAEGGGGDGNVETNGEEQEEEGDGGETVDDGSDQDDEGEAEGAGTDGNAETDGEEPEEDESDEEDDVTYENSPWKIFMNDLFSIHIKIRE